MPSPSMPVRITTGYPSDPVRIDGPLPNYPNTVTVGDNLSDYTTIQAAIDAITDAVADNPYQINIAPGVYTEDITGKAWVNLYGPSADVVGNLTMPDNCVITLGIITAAGTVVTKTGSALSVLNVEQLTVANGGIGILNQTVTSILHFHCNRLQVGASGIGIGDGTTGFGHTHLDIQDLYLAGDSAIGIAALGSRNIVGFIDHILELGTPVTTTGIAVLANGVVRISVSEVVCDVVYNVVATGTLHIVAANLSGTRTQAGGANVRENGFPTTNPGAGLVYINNGVPTVGS